MKPAFVMAIIALSFACGLPACSLPKTDAQTPATSASMESSCINPSRIRSQKILNDQEIQFTLSDSEIWINHLPRTCPGLKSQQGFTWEVLGMQVCSNQQTIYVNEVGTPCQLGAFTRVPKTP
jgi:hypothetical protein